MEVVAGAYESVAANEPAVAVADPNHRHPRRCCIDFFNGVVVVVAFVTALEQRDDGVGRLAKHIRTPGDGTEAAESLCHLGATIH